MLWRLIINEEPLDGSVNMAIDETLMLSQTKQERLPTLRFYSWKPAALSLGYFQRANSEIDLDACRKTGVDVVRRLTGGRAVLHDKEVTYSICVAQEEPWIPPTITASYRYFSQGIAKGLSKMGIDSQMSMPRAAYGQTQKQVGSPACFDAPSHYEMTVVGRKLAGSAQVRKNGVILQHGSLLLEFDPEKLAGLFLPSSTGKGQKLADALSERAISLSEMMDPMPSWDAVCVALIGGFQEALGLDFLVKGLTEGEQQESHELSENKYRQDSWTLRR